MYAAHGTWDEYTHLEAQESEQALGINRATGAFTNEDNEGSTLISWTRDEEPEGNPFHARHVLSRRPLGEMLRDAAATGYLERTAHGIDQGPRVPRRVRT